MTCASPTRAFSIWRSPASPRRWWQISQMFAMPVAAIGWPFDSRPPDTLTGVLPSRHVAPDSEEVGGAALLAQAEVVVVHELGGREAVVQLDEVEVVGADAGLLVGLLRRVRVSVLTLGRIWHASSHGSVVSTDADDLHRAAAAARARASSASRR